MSRKDVPRRQLRSFGLIVGGGFLVIALWPLVFRGESPRAWALIITSVLIAGALVLPGALKYPFHVWMAIGAVLGWINTRILLGVVYYAMIVPIGLFFRAIGRDSMRRKLDPDAQTYRVARIKRPASHMQRQY